MQSFRLHIAGNGMTLVMSRCKVCDEVSKHLISDAIAGTITCAKCGREMDMRDATIEAIAAADMQGGVPGIADLYSCKLGPPSRRSLMNDPRQASFSNTRVWRPPILLSRIRHDPA